MTPARERWRKKVREGGKGDREKEGERVLRQLDFFLLPACLIRCPFMVFPVVGRRERDTHRHKAEVSAAEREGRWEAEGCEQRNYELSA